MGSLPEDECPALQASSGAGTSRSSASVWPSPSCACVRFACWPRSGLVLAGLAVFFVGFDP
jgi:hypothetical protein